MIDLSSSESHPPKPVPGKTRGVKRLAWGLAGLIVGLLVLGYMGYRMRQPAVPVPPGPTSDASEVAPEGVGEGEEIEVRWDSSMVSEPAETDAGRVSFRNEEGSYVLLLDGQDMGVTDGNLAIVFASRLGSERVVVVHCSDYGGSAVIPPNERVLLLSLGASGIRSIPLHEGPIHDLAERSAGEWRVVGDTVECHDPERGTITYRDGRVSYRLVPEYQVYVDRMKAIQEEKALVQGRPKGHLNLDADEPPVLTRKLARKPIPPGEAGIDQATQCRTYLLVLQAPTLVESRRSEAESVIDDYEFLGDPRVFDPLVGRVASVVVQLGFNGRGALLTGGSPHRLALEPAPWPTPAARAPGDTGGGAGPGWAPGH